MAEEAAGGSDDSCGRSASGGVAITEVGICDSAALGAFEFLENNPISPLLHFHFSTANSAHAAFPCTTSARPLRLRLISAFGARITTGTPKLIAPMAFLKSLGIIQEIFRPSDFSTSSGAMSQPFFT